MKMYFSLLATALCGVAVAQNPPPATPSPAQPSQPGRTQTPPPTDANTPASARAAQGIENIVTEWRLEDLPPAVQKTVRERSGGQKIADIDREDRTGSTVWEVEFEREGRNTEIHVANDGKLIPESQAGLIGGTPSAAGAPPSAQTGSRPVDPKLGPQWQDLPKAVQDKAAQFGGIEKAADIDLETWQGRVAYEVEFKRPGRNLEIHFAPDGTILHSNDPSIAPGQGSAPAAEQGQYPPKQGQYTPKSTEATTPSKSQPTPDPDPTTPKPEPTQPPPPK